MTLQERILAAHERIDTICDEMISNAETPDQLLWIEERRRQWYAEVQEQAMSAIFGGLQRPGRG